MLLVIYLLLKFLCHSSHFLHHQEFLHYWPGFLHLLSLASFLRLMESCLQYTLLSGGDVLTLSLPPQSSHGGLDGGDDVTVPLDGGHVDHPGKVLLAVVDGGEEELGYSFLAPPGVCDPWAIKFFSFFLSSPPQYTCCSLDDDALVLLLLVEGPVVVTEGEGDGKQACFF